MTLGGIILCGGQSARMGQPKAWLPFGGELLLPRVLRLLRTVAHPVLIVAAPGQSLPPLPDATEVVWDTVPQEGPLRGLATGLVALLGRCDAVFVTACDSPFLQPAFVRKLGETLDDWDAVIPVSEGQPHPLTACYRITTLPHALALLTQGKRRMHDFLARLSTRQVTAESWQDVDPQGLSLSNVNTPEEYERATRLLDTQPPEAG